MASETIDHTTLKRLVEAGAVSSTYIVGQPGGWGVVVRYGVHERPLASKRGAARIFRKFETLVPYLKGIGIDRYEVDARLYDPDALAPERRREDASTRLKKAHEAAAYEKWFREQVEEAVAEAEDPNTEWVSHEEASAGWAKKRVQLAQRIQDLDEGTS